MGQPVNPHAREEKRVSGCFGFEVGLSLLIATLTMLQLSDVLFYNVCVCVCGRRFGQEPVVVQMVRRGINWKLLF